MHTNVLQDIRGNRYGRLTVIDYVGKDKSNHSMWKCKCDCGNEIVTAGYRLKDRTCKSCGCYRVEFSRQKATIHGMAFTRLHKEWDEMKYRCSSQKRKGAHRYFGRGIKVCDEWINSFENFKEWALANGYDDSLTLDRIDNNKGYSPDNCRWADRIVQQRNKENNVVIEYEGVKKTLAEWAEDLGMNYGTLHSRLKRWNWDIEKAFKKPLRKR